MLGFFPYFISSGRKQQHPAPDISHSLSLVDTLRSCWIWNLLYYKSSLMYFFRGAKFIFLIMREKFYGISWKFICRFNYACFSHSLSFMFTYIPSSFIFTKTTTKEASIHKEDLAVIKLTLLLQSRKKSFLLQK